MNRGGKKPLPVLKKGKGTRKLREGGDWEEEGKKRVGNWPKKKRIKRPRGPGSLNRPKKKGPLGKGTQTPPPGKKDKRRRQKKHIPRGRGD